MSLINVGSEANDGTGDPLRTAFQKLNANVPRFYFANVGTAIENDTALTYTSGQMNSVAEGDTIWTQDGFRFSVLASGASDYHRETGGGVKLWAEPAPDGSVSILQFGASTSASNNAPMIQAALNAFDVIRVPEGIFGITAPLEVGNGKKILGWDGGGGAMGSPKCRIRKTTNTAISGGPRDGINAIIVAWRGSGAKGDFVSHVQIKDIMLEADAVNKVEYGIHAADATMWYMENVAIDLCRIGFFTHDAWLMNFQSVYVRGVTIEQPSVGPVGGWDTSTHGPVYGFVWDHYEGVGAGPGNTFTSCWARNVSIGWYIRGMGYSTFNSCAADQISRRAWYFESSRVSLNGCGTENCFMDPALMHITGTNSYVALNGFSTDPRMRGNDGGGETATILITAGANVVMNACRFNDFSASPGPGNSHNIIVKGSGSHLVTNQCQFPTNGNSNVLYQNGATWVETRNGETRWKNANGTTTQGPPR